MTDLSVKIFWTEEVNYRSVVTVDAAEVLDWINEGVAEDGKITDPSQIEMKDVLEFLREGDEADWFDQCDTTADFYSVEDRDLERVESVTIKKENP